MSVLICCLILFSHVMACIPLIQKLLKGRSPAVVDFACASFLAYYDMGLVFEAAGFPYDSSFFASLFEANGEVLALSTVLLVTAPWVLRLGARLAGNQNTRLGHPRPAISCLHPSARLPFYLLAGLVAVGLAAWGSLQVMKGDSIWVIRHQIGDEWGTAIIILYLPLHCLAFYLRQTDAQTRAGMLFTGLLLVATILTTLPIGQRTNILLPFLLIILFGLNISPVRLLAGFAGLFLLSALLLPIFKWTASGHDSSKDLATVINGDFARAGVLRAALELSEPVGTKVCPAPGSGYLYSTLFFLPRQLVPFKGYSSATYFTAWIAGGYPETIDWGFGVGMMEEASLNFGIAFLLPVLLVYGIVFGLLDRAVSAIPALLIPTSLAGMWSCGYHLPALLLTFGMMGAVCSLLHRLLTAEGAARPDHNGPWQMSLMDQRAAFHPEAPLPEKPSLP